MKKLFKTTHFAIYILLMCVGCGDQPSLTEQIGRDVRIPQSDSEKGYKQTEETWINVDTVFIDTTIIKAIEDGKYKYYRININTIE